MTAAEKKAAELAAKAAAANKVSILQASNSDTRKAYTVAKDKGELISLSTKCPNGVVLGATETITAKEVSARQNNNRFAFKLIGTNANGEKRASSFKDLLTQPEQIMSGDSVEIEAVEYPQIEGLFWKVK